MSEITERVQERWDGFDWSTYGNALRGVQAVKDIHALLGEVASLAAKVRESERQRDEAENEIWEDVLKSVQRAWEIPHDYCDSPLELVTELIDERDELTAKVRQLEQELKEKNAGLPGTTGRANPLEPAPRRENLQEFNTPIAERIECVTWCMDFEGHKAIHDFCDHHQAAWCRKCNHGQCPECVDDPHCNDCGAALFQEDHDSDCMYAGDSDE